MQNQNTLLLNRQTGKGVSHKLVFDMQIIPVGRECKSVTGVMIYNAELVHIIYTDTADIKAFTKELSAIGRNINQIAKRINAGGPAYQADMDEIRERLDEIWQLQRHILSSQR